MGSSEDKEPAAVGEKLDIAKFLVEFVARIEVLVKKLAMMEIAAIDISVMVGIAVMIVLEKEEEEELVAGVMS